MSIKKLHWTQQASPLFARKTKAQKSVSLAAPVNLALVAAKQSKAGVNSSNLFAECSGLNR